MTDKQIVDAILRRIDKTGIGKNLHMNMCNIGITSQYGKHLYFSVCFSNSINQLNSTSVFAFSNGSRSLVFKLNVPPSLDDWKKNVLYKLSHTTTNFISYDKLPSEVIHIFSHAIISALNAPDMSLQLMTMCSGKHEIFAPDETYEMIQIESDMMSV